eukprot:COSAG01_NODE_2400_length_7761_cov_120.247194_13_plen_160_part_00
MLLVREGFVGPGRSSYLHKTHMSSSVHRRQIIGIGIHEAVPMPISIAVTSTITLTHEDTTTKKSSLFHALRTQAYVYKPSYRDAPDGTPCLLVQVFGDRVFIGAEIPEAQRNYPNHHFNCKNYLRHTKRSSPVQHATSFCGRTVSTMSMITKICRVSSG